MSTLKRADEQQDTTSWNRHLFTEEKFEALMKAEEEGALRESQPDYYQKWFRKWLEISRPQDTTQEIAKIPDNQQDKAGIPDACSLVDGESPGSFWCQEECKLACPYCKAK